MRYSSYDENMHCTCVLDCSTIIANIFKISKSLKYAQILQGNPLPSKGIHIIIPLTKFEEHIFILLVSCPDKCADNQALITKYFVKLHFIPAILL